MLGINEDVVQMNMMRDFVDMTSEQQQAAIVQVLSVKNTSAVLNIASFAIFCVSVRNASRYSSVFLGRKCIFRF